MSPSPLMRFAPRLRSASPGAVATLLKRGFGILASFVIAGTAFAETVPAVGDEFRDCAACPLMKVVPAGRFEKGPPPSTSGHFHNEGVVRTITIARPFAVGKFEISVAQWHACVAAGQCARGERGEPEGPDYPAVGVSWDAAVAYTEWLAELTGKPYRLLSETEWEYAARAGLPRFRYFSMTPEQVCQVANVYDLSSKAEFDFDWEHLPCDDGFAALAPTGSLRPNAFGLHDMLGNVAEWTEDCHNRSWRFAKLDGSAWLEGDCLVRAYRGGSWLANQPRYLRTPDRYRYYRARSDDLGFRVGLSLP
jgi:formylglycine-generating enzyme required for sulfatase activity